MRLAKQKMFRKFRIMRVNLVASRRRCSKGLTFLLQISEDALCARSNRLHSWHGFIPIIIGEFLRLCGEFLRRSGEFLRLCGEFLRRNGEFLRRALCKSMFSNTYSAPESRRILNLLERGGTIKIVLAVFPFRERTSYTFCVQRCICQAGHWVEALRRAAMWQLGILLENTKVAVATMRELFPFRGKASSGPCAPYCGEVVPAGGFLGKQALRARTECRFPRPHL